MKKLIMTAAVAMIATGAYAQNECPLKCGKGAAEAKVTQVADEAKTCSAEKAAQCSEKTGAAITQVADKGDGCCADKGAAKVTQVAGATCSAEKAAQCAEKASACSGEGAAITLASAKGKDCGDCSGGDCAGCPNKASCDKGEQVSFESWRQTIPAMAYNVGGKTTTCPKTAASICEKTGEEMTYVVNGQTFETEAEAMAAHTAALNAHLDSMTRVSFVVGDEKIDCPMTAGQMCEKTGQAMKYRVGPAVFDSAEEAVKAAAMAYGMAQSVAMSYEVDGKATTCSKTAAKMCNGKAGAMTYVVGQTKTRCNVQADHVLASERVSKALEALEMVTRQS